MLDQAVERASRAVAAKAEFLDPALEVIAAEYLTALTRLASSEPWETGKISKLAIAMRVIEKVQEQLTAIIAAGEIADRQNDRARQIEQIPEVRRNMLQRMGMTV